jgi:haloacetate dehalogenase
MERRTFIGAHTAGSLGAKFARAQDEAHVSTFETSQVEVSGNTVFVRRYGKGPAILLVQGFPRTSLMWRFVAPSLPEVTP